jgi:hypothetical protein
LTENLGEFVFAPLPCDHVLNEIEIANSIFILAAIAFLKHCVRSKAVAMKIANKKYAGRVE